MAAGIGGEPRRHEGCGARTVTAAQHWSEAGRTLASSPAWARMSRLKWIHFFPRFLPSPGDAFPRLEVGFFAERAGEAGGAGAPAGLADGESGMGASVAVASPMAASDVEAPARSVRAAAAR